MITEQHPMDWIFRLPEKYRLMTLKAAIEEVMKANGDWYLADS
jgi:hypothetical protein